MSVRIFCDIRRKLPYILALILLCSGYFNYFIITEPVVFFFRISSFTGQVLVNKFLSLCNSTSDVVKLTYSFFQILYEDALIFLKDATEKFTFAIHLLKELYLFLEGFGWNFIQILFQVADSISSVCGFVQGLFGTVRNGLLLTGSTIWCFFTSIPETLVSNMYGISEFIQHTFSEIISSTFKLKERIIQILEKTYLFIFDFSHDSVYGLIIGAIILTILTIKFKDICFILSKMFLKLYQQALSVGVSLWNGRFLEHKVTSDDDKSSEDDERLCIVCQNELKEVIIFPCKHLCLCMNCNTHLMRHNPKCPICRTEITGTLKVYV